MKGKKMNYNDIEFKILVEKIKEDLKNKVNEKRYIHSCLVAEVSKKLAKTYGENEKEAYLTGLSHDIAKDFSDEENKYFAKKYNLPEYIFDDSYKKILHSDIGAVVCKEWYNFSDKMANAIKYHTIGNETMTTFEKIIFISDKIGRENIPEDLIPVKDIVYKNLDEAVLFFLTKQKEKFDAKGKKQAVSTIKLMENLKRKLNGECNK